MNTIFKILFTFVFSLILSACSSKTYTIEIHKKDLNSKEHKKVAVFLDGTANDRTSKTNISRMFEIISNQNKDNLYLFYNEGVGTSSRILGAAIGWGIGKDVRQAYSFLSEHYKSDDKLYIFGFSRGSYTARILAGMIHTVGIYDLSVFNKKDKEKIIKSLYYDAYKSDSYNISKTKKDITYDSKKIIQKWQKKRNIKKDIQIIKTSSNKEIEIDILALWETVEALGIQPTIESIKDKYFNIEDKQIILNPNKHYSDQICNIKKVFHALSLDDNRAFVFTPIIISGKNTIKNCPSKSIQETVKEVWFSGAHADVGGGYKEDNMLSGVSLNWMLKEIDNYEQEDTILPTNYEVYENIFAKVHNAEQSISAAYRTASRLNILKKYANKSTYEFIQIHPSVKERLENQYQSKGFDSKWYDDVFFKNCIEVKEVKKGTKITFKDCGPKGKIQVSE